MIHTARQKQKFKHFMRLIRPKINTQCIDLETVATGLLERLWHCTMMNAKRGDIGSMPNDAIAEEIGWYGDADEIVEILVDSKWLDRCVTYRLLVHDWHDHAPRHIKQNIARLGGFVTHREDRDVKQPPTVSPETLSDDQASQVRRKASTPNQTKPNLTLAGLGGGAGDIPDQEEIIEHLKKIGVSDNGVSTVLAVEDLTLPRVRWAIREVVNNSKVKDRAAVVVLKCRDRDWAKLRPDQWADFMKFYEKHLAKSESPIKPRLATYG